MWCGEILDDLLPGVAWELRPAYIWYGNLIFNKCSFFPGKWYVELYKRMAGRNKVFLKRDGFELRDTFIECSIVYPHLNDTVYGRENIVLELYENHWAKVKVTITSTPVKGKSTDTTIEFHVYRMQKPGGKAIPFDFGFEFGKIYKIVADATDYSGNHKVDSTFCVVGRPNIDVILNPNEVLPNNIPNMPQNGNRTEVIVKVTTPSGRPVSGWPISLNAKGVPGSGGHDHYENRPIGNFQQNSGETNENGEFRTFYFASEFGGIERIIAYGGEIIDSADLTVRVSELYLLPESPYYLKIGGTSKHHGPPGYPDDHNHFGTNDLIDVICLLAFYYVNNGGEIIKINDMSLPYGGLFDIYGNWQPPHKTHRIGTNADISGQGIGNRFLFPKTMRSIVELLSWLLGLNISYGWHNNHYHFYVSRRR